MSTTSSSGISTGGAALVIAITLLYTFGHWIGATSLLALMIIFALVD